jgi:hypothetical protein
MATALPPFAAPRRTGRLVAGWAVVGAGVLLGLLLLVAVISPGPTAAGCGDESDGDVIAVGRYPAPLTFGGAMLLPAQLEFADVVAKRVRWDLAVIRAQVYNEMNGPFAARRVAEHNHNWLNVSYDDNLGGRGRLDGRHVWRDPITAGNATADWIQGKRKTLGEQGADSIRTAYTKGASASPQEAIALLQRSGWASSGYPNLPAIYARIRRASNGAAVSTPVASCGPAPVGGGVAAAGGIARGFLGATRPAQMPGFTGPFPAGQWCSWFVTNVLRKTGVEIPVLPYSGAPYTWAADHPEAWTLFKSRGRPAIGPTPAVGSLVMYTAAGGGSPTNSDHINMVARTYPDGSFDVIGGNQGCPTGGPTCVSEHKACELAGWKTAREPHLEDCGDDRPIWGIVTPHGERARA